MPSDSFKLNKAFAHAFGKTHYRGLPAQEVYESQFKSLGNILLKDVWAGTIPYKADTDSAITEAGSNPSLTYYDQATMVPVPGSNNQAYRLELNGTPVRPWVAPVDVPDPATNFPSDGYEAKLFTQSGSPISTTEGHWVVDYYAGIIMFQEGYTPPDMVANGLDILTTWGDVKLSVFAYTGQTLADTGGLGGTGSSSIAGLTDVNLGTPQDGDVLTYSASQGKWVPSSVTSGGGVSVTSTSVTNNTTTVVNTNNLLNFRTLKYVLSVESSNKFSSMEILVLNRNNAVEYTPFAILGDTDFYDWDIRVAGEDMILEITNNLEEDLTVKFSGTIY